MKLTGLHLLLTYRCSLECDHCFVWGSPWQKGAMTLGQIRDILGQAEQLGTVEWIYFEGGEPFLYYATLLGGAREAAERGFQVGIVSNGYWATSPEDAVQSLRPFVGLVQDISVSSDLFHNREPSSPEAEHARAAATQLGIPFGVIAVAQPANATDAPGAVGQLPQSESAVMYRGRAAAELTGGVEGLSSEQFTECPYEDLREPGRVHVDPLGNVHICQGISLGNLFETPLREISGIYDPNAHPITGPLLEGGPVQLALQYDVPCRERYADACHMCDSVRRTLRTRLPEVLTPDQMYGVPAGT
jgi:MoaA/NifB/PqqE/SkfB family radical SAM enzyme